MWYQTERLERELPEVLGLPGQSLSQIFASTLLHPRYVYLTRADRLRQAISLVRAGQTGRWRSMDSSSKPAAYDAEAISGAIRFLEEDSRNWEQFFERNMLHPCHVSYEDLTSNRPAAIEALLKRLGHDLPLPVSAPQPKHERQSDGQTEEWVQRYLLEHAEQAER